jgi:hypothetical protein
MRNTPTLPLAALATQPSPKVGPNYLFIPTKPLVEALTQEGFELHSASQKRTRKAGYGGFAGHELVFRPHRDGALQVDDLTPQVVVINGHDGSTALKFRASVCVLWCNNGAVRDVANLADVRVRHTGKLEMEDFIEGAFKVLSKSTEWADTLTEWQSIPLALPDRVEFAERALALRYPEGNAPVEAPLALTVRHQRDFELRETLFGCFNSLQGNLIQHGMPVRNRGRRSLRKVTGDSFYKYNEELALLAEEYAAKA